MDHDFRFHEAGGEKQLVATVQKRGARFFAFDGRGRFIASFAEDAALLAGVRHATGTVSLERRRQLAEPAKSSPPRPVPAPRAPGRVRLPPLTPNGNPARRLGSVMSSCSPNVEVPQAPPSDPWAWLLGGKPSA